MNHMLTGSGLKPQCLTAAVKTAQIADGLPLTSSVLVVYNVEARWPDIPHNY